MGVMKHNAIVVTSMHTERLVGAYVAANNLGLGTTPIVEGDVNGYASFLVIPDGSKEGWPQSDAGDELREVFKAWLRNDENFWGEWAEVQYGGSNDGYTTEVIDSNDR